MSDKVNEIVAPLTDDASVGDIKARIAEADAIIDASEALLKVGIVTNDDIAEVHEIRDMANRLLKLAEKRKV